MSYYTPFLLITADSVRNNSIADRLEYDLKSTIKVQKDFYENLPDSYNKKALMELLELVVVKDSFLIDALRCDMNILNTSLPDMDRMRLKPRMRRALSTLRRRVPEILHDYDDHHLSDNAQKPEMWDEHPIFSTDNLSEWNSVFLKRVSEIHKHMSKLVYFMEGRILVNSDAELTMNIPKILETSRLMVKEIRDTFRLIGSL